ncbi:hypothetical protein THAOC_09107 [Thalassiosira oceanica]|uniref:Uncharacterized protein n=1 Tax=Thalassiosira oceanica TaxID=159749 RepID=K0ST89_THAOC|nr:hypothetical protein THAOC_09107 [Thalassiosira oceanica]|eukprot:EJK69613.1 hypothetical protein THAOC_09107 [Thalassiosira oceanica]
MGRISAMLAVVGGFGTCLDVCAFQQQMAIGCNGSRLALAEGWTGEVVSNANEDGSMRGCTIMSNDETTHTVKIDGLEADLGKFSAAVYRKVTGDAKQTVLEALQQNNVRPFSSAREDIQITQVSIPPKPGKKKKKKGGKKKGQDKSLEETKPVATWETYPTLNEALKAGWEPGQSFSFVASNVKGQKVEQVDMKPKPVI